MAIVNVYLSISFDDSTTVVAADIISAIEGEFMAPEDVTIVEENPFTPPILSDLATGVGLEATIVALEAAYDSGDYTRAEELATTAHLELETMRKGIVAKKSGVV